MIQFSLYIRRNREAIIRNESLCIAIGRDRDSDAYRQRKREYWADLTKYNIEMDISVDEAYRRVWKD